MMLGTDVSGLSTTAANAAAQGLSIVVPLYNEAAGLALLHERLIGLAKHAEGSATASPAKWSMSMTAAPTRRSTIARGLAADALDVQVVSLSRNFGKEAALMAGLDHARRGAVLFMDGDGQHPPTWSRSWSATGSMTATTWSIPPRRIATMNRSCAGWPCTASTR